MNSSGMKRGLATAAVSALAVTGIGLAAGPATAVTLTSSVAPTAVVVTAPDTPTASTAGDGQNTTIRLEAVAGSDVAQVRFEYSAGGGYNAIATVARNDNGAFSFEWPAAGLDGDAVQVRAVGLDAQGATLTTTAPDALTVSSTAASVNVTDGTAVGVFQKPDYDDAGPDAAHQNVAVSGTASDPASAPALSFWDPSAAAYAPGGSATSTTPAGATTGTWAGVMDITGYDYGASDELLVKATDTTDDAESFGLYKQTITTVDAQADRTTVPTGSPANVTVTVSDQNAKPIAGAEVRDSNGVLIGQTDRNGRVTATQNGGAAYYYANATASDPYEPNLGDKQSQTITVTEYTPVPTTLVASSADGPAFDFDEYASGDITVQVKDQNNNNRDTTAQTLSYHWTVTPFAGGPAQRFPANGESTQPVDTNGNFVVAFPAGAPEGTYVLTAALGADALGNGAVAAATVLTVKAGQADVVFAEDEPEQAAAGTSEEVAGSLALDDGTGLANRNLALTFTRGSESGTGAGAADAGIVQADNTLGLTRNLTTGADGGFTATVKDPAETPQPQEIGGALDVSSAATPGIGNAGASDSQGVDFLNSLTPTDVTVTTNNPAGTPGEPEPVDVEVRNADGVLLTNTDVTLTLDHGFFTDGTPDPAPAVGADAGEYASLGQSITLTTDGNGAADALLTIERDAGFDDDGQVTATVTAKAGQATGDDTQLWDSSNPLNGGSVAIERASADEQTVSVLPKAPTNESVFYDVYATDQFGNLTDVPVQVTDDLGAGSVNGIGSGDTVTSQFEGDAPSVELGSSAAGTQTPTATWAAGTTKYVAPLPSVSTTGTETLTDTGEAVSWYVIDFAASTYTLTHDVTGTRPVGSTVLETYTAIDQNGEPINGVSIGFFRSGPDALHNGELDYTTATGQDGKVSYVFAGTTPGNAIVEALITDYSSVGGDQIVPQSRRSDTVTFAAAGGGGGTTPPTPPAPTQSPIEAALKGSSTGAKDKIVVDAPSVADGAKVTLYKKVKGKLIRLKVKTLNGSGDATLSVRDRNGKAATKYVVVVDATADSQADRTKLRLK